MPPGNLSILYIGYLFFGLFGSFCFGFTPFFVPRVCSSNQCLGSMHAGL